MGKFLLYHLNSITWKKDYTFIFMATEFLDQEFKYIRKKMSVCYKKDSSNNQNFQITRPHLDIRIFLSLKILIGEHRFSLREICSGIFALGSLANLLLNNLLFSGFTNES